MKHYIRTSYRVIAGLLLALPVLHAQSCSMDWFKESGGGTSTIGQPDASGALTGGNYSVTGGFWSLYAVHKRLAHRCSPSPLLATRLLCHGRLW
jgi:hypothetical protein